MFKIAPMYEEILKDEEVIKILCNFHSSVWNKFKKQDMKNVILALDERIMFLQGKPARKFNFVDEGVSGSYSDFEETITICLSSSKNISQYDILDTYFHETRHAFQHQAVYEKMPDGINVTMEQIKDWETNFKIYNEKRINYVPYSNPLYFFQAVEADAFTQGMLLTHKAAHIIKSKMGEDFQYVKYVESCSVEIEIYLLDEFKSNEKLKEEMNKLSKIYKSNEKVFLENDQTKLKLDCILKKGIEKTEKEELYSLLCSNVWELLSLKEKQLTLQQFDKIRKGNFPRKLIKIDVDNRKEYIKIEDEVYLSYYLEGILNNILDYQVKLEANDIINDKVDFNQPIKKDLKINLCLHNKKKINYTNEKDNYFHYLIQPYGIYESHVVCNCLEEIKKASESRFGKSSLDWQRLIDFYSFDKTKKAAEKLYDCDFILVYNKNLDKMVKKITQLKGTKTRIKEN